MNSGRETDYYRNISEQYSAFGHQAYIIESRYNDPSYRVWMRKQMDARSIETIDDQREMLRWLDDQLSSEVKEKYPEYNLETLKSERDCRWFLIWVTDANDDWSIRSGRLFGEADTVEDIYFAMEDVAQEAPTWLMQQVPNPYSVVSIQNDCV